MIAVALGFGACGPDEVDPKEEGIDDGKADAWDYRNDPERFRVEFQYRLTDLPMEGEADQLPWPDDYWSYYNDSINFRWRGQQNLSPAEAYDAAFNGWSPPQGYMDLRPRANRATEWDAAYYEQLGPLASEVHRRRGNNDMVNGVDDDGDGEVDECDSEDCDGIEFWWGVCHAWAPAAIMEPEPIDPVEHNGQTFYPSDIKSLMMINYDSTQALMLGGRCNARDVDRDENGRAIDPDCQDVNAGAFHVVITNMLGRLRRAFDEDRTYDYQVWNQPIRGYDITSQEEGLSAADAMAALGLSDDTYSPNADAVSFAEVRMNTYYITEAHPSEYPRIPQIDRYTRTDRYHYILELNAEGEIIGGEWGPSSQSNHPDFLWLPTNHGSYFQHITYENVRMLLDMSRNGGGGGGGGEGEVFETRPDLSIPDNDPAGVTVPLDITAEGDIESLQVAVDIEHTYIGDLTVTLIHNGTEVSLQRHQGGSADDLVQTFAVNDFNGQPIAGHWELFVSDDAGQDIGRVRRFALVAVLGEGGTVEPPPENTYVSTGAVSIPDNNEGGASSTINVPDSGVIGGTTVHVNIEHTYIGDLVVELRHNGQVRTLHNRSGGSADNIENDFQIQEFNGQSIQGTWDLFVSDHAGADVGQIADWSITFNVTGDTPVDPPDSVRPSAAGQIVFTEVLANPNGVWDSEGEWFEVYNTSTDTTYDLSGAVFADNDGDTFTVEGAIVIEPGEWFTFGRSQETTVNGGAHVDYGYGSAMTLANSDDELVLTVGGVEIDRIVYTGGWPLTTGAAFQLDPSSIDYTANDDAASWCPAQQEFGTVSDRGTPGQPNHACD